MKGFPPLELPEERTGPKEQLDQMASRNTWSLVLDRVQQMGRSKRVLKWLCTSLFGSSPSEMASAG